jgi:AAA domain, putative AbiEii toxin, Type IV TA system
MISSIQIDGYRGFEHFGMADLGRLNLLVGTNNSGKTSVLEAIYLLTSRGDPLSLWQFLWRRGERVPGASNPRRPDVELDICHLFSGHDAHIGSKFTLSAKNQSPERSITFSIGELGAKERNELQAESRNAIPSRLVLHIKGNPQPPMTTLPLSRAGGISPDMLEAPPRRLRKRAGDENPSQFITAESLDSDDLVSLWDKVALTPNEDLVLKALRFLDPSIDRIAAQATGPNYYPGSVRGGFILKCRGIDQPIPIGSMGDGMWRMLALAIAITQCRGGVLLVDEIDTGLHYTVMSDMWRLIFGAAKQLDVQVFATTHSFDCIRSLATVCTSDELFTGGADFVTLQRIEKGRVKSIPYTQAEINMAAERGIEVR